MNEYRTNLTIIIIGEFLVVIGLPLFNYIFLYSGLYTDIVFLFLVPLLVGGILSLEFFSKTLFYKSKLVRITPISNNTLYFKDIVRLRYRKRFLKVEIFDIYGKKFLIDYTIVNRYDLLNKTLEQLSIKCKNSEVHEQVENMRMDFSKRLK